MRPERVPVVVLCLLAACLSHAGESVVWQIGTADKSHAEFAISGDYAAFPKRFAKGVVFVAGKGSAERDWPFIHPGPSDAWAGHGVHPFRVRFELGGEPKGVFRLTIDLVDTHSQAPPVYEVAVNGRSGRFKLPRGSGDDSLTNPKRGKPHRIELPVPASALRKGANEIALACRDGSWVTYDAVTLRNDPDAALPTPEVKSVTVTPTPFFIKEKGKVLRAVDVAVALSSPAAELTLRVEAGGERSEVPVAGLSMFGSASQEVGVPVTEGPLKVSVTALVGEKGKSATATVSPQRQWRIFVAASAHTDIGYTDIQPRCMERHNQNLDLAAKLLASHPDFRWNCEVALQAVHYLATRTGERRDAFLRLAKERKLGVQALYCNILTGLCHHEELIRLTYAAQALHREHGIPFRSAMLNDVPTPMAAMPMVLAGSGIRYFSEGCNNYRAPTFNRLYAKSPCWWEGPDGSRVLMIWVPSYAYASRLGLDASLETARQRILASLRGYEARKDYPYDAIFANGAVSDNCPLNANLATVAEAWNERYAFPKIILCHNAEFFEYIEKQWGDKLPVVRGSGGAYWEDGAGSTPQETALNRNAHETLVNAEKLLALCGAASGNGAYPRRKLAEAWHNVMLFDEHTWGAHSSVSEPESEFTKAQWRIKAQFAYDADRQARDLLDEGLLALRGLVRTAERSLVVVNPMSWPRTDVVELTPPGGDDALASPSNIVQTRYVLAKDVPACGYRVMKLGDGAVGVQAEAMAAGTTIESRFYRVAFDPATGAIASILDKELGRELVDPKAAYGANQYLYVAGGKGTRIETGGGPAAKLTVSTTGKASLRRQRIGDLGERMIVGTSAAMTPDVVAEVTVWNHARRIDITNTLRKTLTYAKEGVYLAFPFAAEKPTIRYEEPNAIVNPATDMLPGACLDWLAVQHFVEVEAADAAIAWATPDAPLVCLQDINRGKWQTELPITNGHLYAYAANSYWNTNYRAGWGGTLRVRFAIASRRKADVAASARFGWGVSNPLIAVVAEAGEGATLSRAAGSFVEVAEPNVLLVAAKRAEASDALVLRLWELAGRATTAHVRLPQIKARKATLCTLVETPQQPLELRGDTLLVPLRGHGLATVMVE